MRPTAIFAIAVLLLAATMMSAHAATITVTNTNDSGPGSLRQALANANNGDRINFAVTGAITLTSGGLGSPRTSRFQALAPTNSQLSGNQCDHDSPIGVNGAVTTTTPSGLNRAAASTARTVSDNDQ